MNFHESLNYLYSLQKSGIKFGLENIEKLLDELDNPQSDYKSIHIAGTNGKGSSASFIASILSVMGYKVGLYTSPHLVRFNERIRVDGKEIEDEFLVEMVNSLVDSIKQIKPTFFEVTTAIAFKYFKSKEVDYAVIETGLGGRLDSTNVIRPVISVITSVNFDHKDFLGETLEQIAIEKGGIIKSGVPVVVSKNDDTVKDVLKEIATERNSDILFVDDYYKHRIIDNSLDGLSIKVESELSGIEYEVNSPLIGDYQAENIKTVIAVLEKLFPYQDLRSIISTGIRDLKFPLNGRFQVLHSKPLIILDTCHNEDAIRNFLNNLNILVKENKIAVFGIMRDKEISSVVKLIEESFSKIFLCRARIERSMDVSDLSSKFSSKFIEKFESVEEALSNAINESLKDNAIVVFGSNYVVGEAIEYLEKQKFL